MVIGVSLSDIKNAQSQRAQGASLEAANPLVTALCRATKNDEHLAHKNWLVSKMPIFNEASFERGEAMPQLYLVSDSNENDLSGINFYVLPEAAQHFQSAWLEGKNVAPLSFELPLETSDDTKSVDGENHIFGLTEDLIASLKNGVQRLLEEGNKDVDVAKVRRSLNDIAREANLDVSLDPVFEPVKRSVLRLGKIGRKPVVELGRDVMKILVTPIGSVQTDCEEKN